MEHKSKNKDENTEVDLDYVCKPLEKVIHDSMMPYSEFVIMDRALPRVEDGLKPVQRRVLYSMLEVGVLPDRPFRKSARIVGDCMGKYHPHGDRSIYDTMVRMAQPFNMGETLVTGHGNFGSIDGDGAAAMRYTEAKLSPIALELLRDIEKDTVQWQFNFDDSCKEPVTLPGRFPNLLVNGGSGIAVGLATNIPTHNLKEVISAVCAYIENPKISLDELLKIMPGPDFPTGAYILSSSEIKKLYQTGKGRIFVRSKITIEDADNGKKNIVISEIPYQVNKALMLQKIAKYKETDTTNVMSYISDIVDESDRSGIRAVIKLKKDANIPAILNILYKYCDVQTTFNANMVAIADGKPKQLSLIEIISYYVAYQKTIIYNRTKYDLEECLKKEHILEGLLIAIRNIDEVVRIIKTSKNTTDAKIQLMQTFELDDVQAQAILDMRLARLTSLEVTKLVNELNRLRDLIKRYTAILKSDSMQMKIVKQELSEIGKKYGVDRQTTFKNDDDVLENMGASRSSEIESSEPTEYTNIIASPMSTLKNVPPTSYTRASRELSSSPSEFEIPQINVNIATNKDVYLFTSLGNCVKVPVNKINICKFRDKGSHYSSFYKNYKTNERIVELLRIDPETDADLNLVFVTKLGLIKLTKVKEFISSKTSMAGIKLKDGDELVYVRIDNPSKRIAIFTKMGLGAMIQKDDLKPMGRVSSGVKAITLDKNDEVVCAVQSAKSDAFVIILSNGNAKIIKYADIPEMVRARKGLKMFTSKDVTTRVVLADILDKDVNYVIEKTKSGLTKINQSDMKVEPRTGAGKDVSNKEGILRAYKFVKI